MLRYICNEDGREKYLLHLTNLDNFASFRDLPSYSGKTGLHFAAINNYYEKVQILLSNECSNSNVDKSGLQPIVYAYRNSRKDIVKLFEENTKKGKYDDENTNELYKKQRDVEYGPIISSEIRLELVKLFQTNSNVKQFYSVMDGKKCVVKIIYNRNYDKNNFFKYIQKMHKGYLKNLKKYVVEQNKVHLEDGFGNDAIRFVSVDINVSKQEFAIYRVLGLRYYNEYAVIKSEIKYDISLRVSFLKSDDGKENDK